MNLGGRGGEGRGGEGKGGRGEKNADRTARKLRKPVG